MSTLAAFAGPVDYIIPQPQKVQTTDGTYSLPSKASVYIEATGSDRDRLLSSMEDMLGVTKTTSKASKAAISLVSNADLPADNYLLSIKENGIRIEASTGAGFYYGLQTLCQIAKHDGSALTCLEIEDGPYLQHRGLMVDVSRHFFSKEFILRQIDLMSQYKLNKLHWHLVDGAGWRIEIKSHPELTDQAAYRPCSSIVEWEQIGGPYCTADGLTAYGGYYTQDDIREVVRYASEHYITVIPEIEMPGHSEEVLCVHPELSCAGKPHVNSDLCIGNPYTFAFIKDVLSEVIELFPSEYIHIGGDEAGMAGWKTCDKCNALMQREGIDTYEGLQSYLIRNVEKWLNANGRQLIGWDEIMNGGLSPNATVMAWQSQELGVKAAEMGHDAIMCPISCCYLNMYQDAQYAHVLSWHGYTPIEKVYAFNPIPEGTDAAVSKHIIGMQGNMWAEYVSSERNAETMLWPRGLAIAEVSWTRPEGKDYARFRANAIEAVKSMEAQGYSPFKLYDEVGERPESLHETSHLAVGKPVKYIEYWSEDYPASLDKTLTDGIQGGWSYEDGRWQAFWNDMDVIVDLGEKTQLSEISTTFLQDRIGWYWLPGEVQYSISDDGEIFSPLTAIANTISVEKLGTVLQPFTWNGTAEARYVRCTARRNAANCKHGYMFTDEIIIR